jgi:hypothetical protein
VTSEYLVLWIDDDQERREGDRGGVGSHDRINIHSMGPRDAASQFLTDMEDEGGLPGEPDLALVDWYLQTDEYAGDGPSIEGILRDRFSSIPIYAFSAEYGSPQFDLDRQRGATRFAHITSPQRLDDEDLIQDLEDYEKIRDKEGQGIDGLVDLLDPPSNLDEQIESTVPQEFIQGLPRDEQSDTDSSLRFARWVRNEFLQTPGLIWDDVWTATKTGIGKESFANHSSAFSDAEYTGVFDHRFKRWWREAVKDIVFDRARKENVDINRMWKQGPDLFDVAEGDRSKCDVCERPHRPQTVAARKPDDSADYQVHYDCSNIEQSRAATYEDFRLLVEL